MSVRVLIAFDTGVSGDVNQFTLDSPDKGVIGSSLYGLGGATDLVDVTEYVKAVSVSRGRSRVLDQPQAASANITLDNRTRLFDPTVGTAVSPYADSIRPRRNVVVSVEDVTVFTGLVDDWNLEFPNDGGYTTTAVCTDGFVSLAQAPVTPGTAASQLSGARVDAVLTDIEWPTSKRSLDAGDVTLQADVVGDNVNALAYLQTVATTEYGALFMDRLGNVAFRDRGSRQGFSDAVVLGGTGIPFADPEIDYGSETLYNSISLAREGGGTALSVGTASVAEFGILDYSKTGLLHNSDGDTQDLADFLLGKFAEPLLRISSVRVPLKGLTATQRQTIAALDVADAVEVTFTPAVGPAITQYANVDRLEWSLSPNDEQVLVRLSQAQPAFILGHPVFGVIGSSYGVGF
jgi:hypothetical protein